MDTSCPLVPVSENAPTGVPAASLISTTLLLLCNVSVPVVPSVNGTATADAVVAGVVVVTFCPAACADVGETTRTCTLSYVPS